MTSWSSKKRNEEVRQVTSFSSLSETGESDRAEKTLTPRQGKGDSRKVRTGKRRRKATDVKLTNVRMPGRA